MTASAGQRLSRWAPASRARTFQHQTSTIVQALEMTMPTTYSKAPMKACGVPLRSQKALQRADPTSRQVMADKKHGWLPLGQKEVAYR